MLSNIITQPKRISRYNLYEFYVFFLIDPYEIYLSLIQTNDTKQYFPHLINSVKILKLVTRSYIISYTINIIYFRILMAYTRNSVITTKVQIYS